MTNSKLSKESLRLKIVFLGSRGFVIPVAKALQKHFDLVGIISVPDQPSGRGYHLLPTPVKEVFLDSKIPIFTPNKFTPDVIEKIKQLDADLFVMAAYGKIIPTNILEIPKLGVLNLHPSLLPKYRGASPIQNAILNGDETTGMTFMMLDKEMDHGPIVSQVEFPISDDSTFEDLGNRIFEEASQKIPEVIQGLALGKFKPQEQNHEKAVYVKLIEKEDGYFDINNPPSPEQLDRIIRAYFPWPNAWTRWNGKIVKLLPGHLVQMEGKKPVPLKNFLNGYPDFPLKTLRG
jgi:methionyl-tRNA formyltransferase